MIPAPPGPFRPGFWRSPLRGPWLTAVLGSVLLVLVTIVAVTGFLSHAAYQPDLGSNALVRPDLPFTTFFGWPSGPSWLYALSQGLHVNVGLAVIPVVLAKLWSVIPRLFAWPPVRSASEGFERLTVALLVASTGFLLATGVANIQYWYVFRFDFVRAHYYAAVVFVAALVAHLVVKIPVALRAYRARGVIAPLRAGLADTRPEPGGDLVAAAPDPPTVSRRGLLLAVGAGSLTLAVANAGSSIGGVLRPTAFLGPRRAGGFPVNKTAAGAKVTPEMTGASYRLVVAGAEELSLSRAELLALPQVTHTLTLGCVEGWSTRQTWTGVPLAELARRAGVPEPSEVHIESLQPAGVLRQVTLAGHQVADARSLLALRVAGADLEPDHGYPARIIVPVAARRAQHEVGRAAGVPRMKRRYGASPLHLLVHLAVLALAAWALLQALDLGGAERIVLWLVGAVVLHDLVLWPSYTALDRVARRGRPVGWANYVRLPLGLSALLLLVFFPVMCGKGEAAYTRVSGATWEGYAGRWLLVCAVLFAVSAGLYLARSRGSSS